MSTASSVASSGSAAGAGLTAAGTAVSLSCRSRPSWGPARHRSMPAYSLTGPDAMMICWNATGGLDCEHLPFERAAINSSVKW